DRTLLAIGLLDGDVTLDPRKLSRAILLTRCIFLIAGLAISLRASFGGRGAARLCRYLLNPAAAVCGVEIDNVAQQHFLFVERVAPTDDGANRQWILADAADHHLAASLDALGDRDFALARQQLDGPHLAQIHANGIVGAADVVVIEVTADFAVGLVSLDGRWLVALLALDNIDPELGQHRHGVLDLLRGHLVVRDSRVQL